MNQPSRPLQPPVSRIEIAPPRTARDYALAHRHSGRVRLLKIGLPALVVLGVAGYAALTFLHSGDAGTPTDFGPPPGPDAVVMEAPRLRGFQPDGQPYEVAAASASQPDAAPDLVDLNAVDASFPFGGGSAHVVAATGRYDSAGASLTLSGATTVTTDSGLVAHLQAAIVDLNGGGITSDQPVEIESAGRIISGDRLEIAEGGDRMTLDGNVSVTTAGDPPAATAAAVSHRTPFGTLQAGDGPIAIRADRLEQAAGDGRVSLTFGGHVVATRGGTTLTADAMVIDAPSGDDADGVAVGASQFDRIDATGTVRVASGTQIVTGDHAVMDSIANTATMTGGASFSDGESRLVGNVMVVNLANNDVSVEPARGGRVRFHAPGTGAAGGGTSASAFGGFRTGVGGTTDITADHFFEHADGGDLLLVFLGGVVAVRDGSTVHAAALTVKAPGGSGGDPFDAAAFDEIDAAGNVQVESATSVAVGDAATFDMRAGTIVMTGAVTLTNNGTRLTGNRLSVDLDSGTMSMTPATRATFTPRSGGGP